MHGRKAFLVALAAASTLLLSYPNAWAWQQSINGTALTPDEALAVTVDANGQDFTVIKLRGTDGGDF